MPVQLGIAVNVVNIKDPENIFFKEIGELIEGELDLMERTFDKGLIGWSSDSKPKWKRSGLLPIGRGWLASTMSTEDVPFVWVMGGTKKGRATFSKNYRPMTRSRVISSRARQGRVIARGAGPIVRIKSREWHIEIAERRLPMFEKKMRRLSVRIAKKIIGRSKKIGEITYDLL